MHNPLQIFHDDPFPPDTAALFIDRVFIEFSEPRSFPCFMNGSTVLLSIYRSIKCFMPVCMQRKRSISTVRFFSVLVSRDFMDHWWWRLLCTQLSACRVNFSFSDFFRFFFPLLPQFFSNYWYSIHPIFNSVSYYLIVNYDKS